MLRKKELCTVVTFHTTADALKTEQLCKDRGIKGRLIPVPRCLGTGCDLAYRTGQEHFTAVSELLQQNNIDPVVLVEIEL